MRMRPVLVMVWAGIALLPLSARADDKAMNELLAKLPESVNAVAVINLDALLSSPRGREENWARGYEASYLSGVLSIPPSVHTVVLAAQFDPCTQARTQEYAVARLKKGLPAPLRIFARIEGGEMDTIGGQEVVLSPRHGYVADLGSGIIAGSAPPNRQEFARWLKFAKANKQPVISEYLRTALLAKSSAHILMAFDMENMVSEQFLKAWLTTSETMKHKKSEVADVQKLLLGLKGIRFVATVEQFTLGRVLFDFSDTPTPHEAELMLPLFREWLGDAGAAIDELAGPGVHVHVVKQSVMLDLLLSDESLRRIMTLVPQSSAMDEPPTATNGTPDGAASKRYFQAIDDMLDDLRKMAKGKNYSQSALWHENFARKIRQLATAQVDPSMVQYGVSVASHLRALAASLRGEPIALANLEGQKRWYWYEDPPTVTYNYGGWWGGRPGSGRGWSWGVVPGQTHYYDNFAEIRTKQAEAVKKGEADRTQIWSQLEQERMEIRRKMLDVFQIDVAERKK